MPLFFFDFEDSAAVNPPEARELSDIVTAKCDAVTLMARALCDEPHRFWEVEVYRVTVSDDIGLTLFTLEMVATEAPRIRAMRS